MSPSAFRRSLLALLFLAVLPNLPAVAGQPSAPTGGTLRYFRSNELGMPLEEIGWYRTDEASYVLEVRAEPGREVRILRHDGAELRRWERSARQARTYESGVLAEVELFDSRGRTVELREYDEGSLVARTEFSYPRASEIVATRYDGDGELEFSERSLLSPQGALRSVRREYPQGKRSRLSLSMAGDRLSEERIGTDDRSLLKRYDSQSRIVEQERWSGGKPVERETLEYHGEGRVLARTVTREPDSARSTTRTYDPAGRLESVRVELKGQLSEQIVHERDGEGRVVRTTKRGADGLEQWSYAYDQGGELAREELWRRGALVRVTLFETGGRRIEELYRSGELFLRVTYQDGEKRKEELFAGGTPVRTREYP